VTLHNMVITNNKDPNAPLSMDATARTYRYLDATEVEQVRKLAAGKKAGGAK
jgi:type IV pilus assembly protein PilO